MKKLLPLLLLSACTTAEEADKVPLTTVETFLIGLLGLAVLVFISLVGGYFLRLILDKPDDHTSLSTAITVFWFLLFIVAVGFVLIWVLGMALSGMLGLR